MAYDDFHHQHYMILMAERCVSACGGKLKRCKSGGTSQWQNLIYSAMCATRSAVEFLPLSLLLPWRCLMKRHYACCTWSICSAHGEPLQRFLLHQPHCNYRAKTAPDTLFIECW